MHSSRMHTVCNSSRLLSGGSLLPWSRHPLGSGSHPPGQVPPPWSRPPGADPPTARHAGIPPAMHAGIAPAMHAGIPPAMHAGIPPAMHAGIAPAMHAGIAPAMHAGIAPAMHAGIAPPPVNRITDTCKNITFATSLPTVTILQNYSPNIYIGTTLILTSVLLSYLHQYTPYTYISAVGLFNHFEAALHAPVCP